MAVSSEWTIDLDIRITKSQDAEFEGEGQSLQGKSSPGGLGAYARASTSEGILRIEAHKPIRRIQHYTFLSEMTYAFLREKVALKLFGKWHRPSARLPLGELTKILKKDDRLRFIFGVDGNYSFSASRAGHELFFVGNLCERSTRPTAMPPDEWEASGYLTLHFDDYRVDIKEGETVVHDGETVHLVACGSLGLPGRLCVGWSLPKNATITPDLLEPLVDAFLRRTPWFDNL